MKKLYAGMASALLAAAAGPVWAGGPVVLEPEPAPTVVVTPPPMARDGDWTGFSAGLTLGYAQTGFGAGDGQGALWGLRGAYDQDFGGWVLGGQAGLDWADIDAGGATLTNLAHLGVRAGPDLGDTFVYATGGAARAWQDLAGGGDDDMGWYAGLGVETRMTQNWSVGAELLTNRFDNFAGTGDDLSATTLSMNANFRF